MHTSASSALAAAPSATRRLRRTRLWLAFYGLVLAAIALWPVPVDSGATGVLKAISAAIPWLSYDVIEVTANILLFVPLGILLTLVLPRRRWAVLPIALGVTLLIELSQALFLDARTPSVRDILANLLGALIGFSIVLFVERRSRASVED